MKKLFFSIVSIGWICISAGIAAPRVENSASFTSPDEEVALEIKRVGAEVKLHVFVKDISQYDHVLIERSAESPNYFGRCKYFSATNTQSKLIDVIETDKYPYAASKDVYYRIKTITKDGIERAYPSLLLTAVN